MTSFLYYLDYDTINEQTRDLYRLGICVCADTAAKHLLQAGRGMNFAVRGTRTNLTSTNQKKRKRGMQKMIEKRNVNIITDADGKKLVLINDIRFKAKVRDD